MKKHNLFLGIVMLMISIIYYYMVKQLPERAAIYPTFVAFILGGLSIIFIIKTWISKNEDDKKMFEGFQRKQFIFVLSISFVYIFIVTILGYFVSTLLFLMLCLFGLKADKKYSLFTSVGFSIFILIVFKIILNVPLPRGFIF